MHLNIPTHTLTLPSGWTYGAQTAGGGWTGYHLVHTDGTSLIGRERPDLDSVEDLEVALTDARLLHALRVAARAEQAQPEADAWELPEAAAARALTAELCRPWDFTSWADARELALAGALGGHRIDARVLA